MKKILFVSSYARSNESRHLSRHGQYADFLKTNGFSVVYSSFFDEAFFVEDSYLPLKEPAKFLRGVYRRIQDLIGSSKYDLVILQWDPKWERVIPINHLFRHFSANLVVDYDHFFNETEFESSRHESINSSFSKMINSCRALIVKDKDAVANIPLKNPNQVLVLPQTIHTERYQKKMNHSIDEKIVIGWSACSTGEKLIAAIAEPLIELKENYGEFLEYRCLTEDEGLSFPFPVTIKKIDAGNEISELSALDVGLFPLTGSSTQSDRLSLEVLKYFSMKIPTVVSPQSCFSSLFKSGKNTLICDSPEQWIDHIELMIESTELRDRLAESARLSVLESHSFNAFRGPYLNFIREVVKKTFPQTNPIQTQATESGARL